MISVLIVDDHQMFREGIRSLLEVIPEFSVVGEAENGITALKFIEEYNPNVILMDITMPEMDGIETTKIIQKRFPSTKVVILSMHDTHDFVERALEAGVKGYLPKDATKAELTAAIHKVHEGGNYLNESITATMMAGFKSSKTTMEVRLTPREKDVLKLICKEHTTQEIAEKLFISTHTVETHRKNLLHKTGCKNSVGLLRFAIDNRLFEA